MFDTVLLLHAPFAAGVVNTIAGGGTFLTFPALVFTGMPPILANATSAAAVFPGYLGGALGFRAEIARLGRRALMRMTATALSGGLAGAGLLLVSSDAAFAAVVPFLLIGATPPWPLQPIGQSGRAGPAPRYRGPGGVTMSASSGPTRGKALVRRDPSELNRSTSCLT